MTTAQKAKEFLVNCRVFENGEVHRKGGKGISVLFNKYKKYFIFNEYENGLDLSRNITMGVIYIKDIIDELNADNAIIKFQNATKDIVGEREYKMTKYAYGILTSLHTAIPLLKCCKENELDPEETIRILKTFFK